MASSSSEKASFCHMPLGQKVLATRAGEGRGPVSYMSCTAQGEGQVREGERKNLLLHVRRPCPDRIHGEGGQRAWAVPVVRRRSA